MKDNKIELKLDKNRIKDTNGKITKKYLIKRDLAEAHYSELKQGLAKKFGEEKGNKVFDSVLKYIQGEYHTNRVMALVYQGEDAIKKIREELKYGNKFR